jgi:hypothetical protein
MVPASTLPPQAYTRDILAKAYLWMQNQPDSIRKMAGTPDALVGLFLRAQRNGEASLESVAPVSRDIFISDLKNLANELEQFEGPSGFINQGGQQFVEQTSVSKETINRTRTATQAPLITHADTTPIVYPSQKEIPPPPAVTTTIPFTNDQLNLDQRSIHIIQSVKLRMNLSSDQDALRLLLVMGEEKVNAMFRKE